MSESLQDQIKTRLAAVIDPYTQQSLTANNALVSLEVNASTVALKLRKGYPVELVYENLSQLIHQALRDVVFAQRDLEIEIEQRIISHSVQQGTQAVAGVKNIIAVASGKGGVGKSTVSANLSLALRKAGANVAILDADIYGPSQPRMLGVSGKPDTLPNKMLLPLQSMGIKIMSIGFMIEEDTPMIWRGPMVTQALEQMLRGTSWNNDGVEVDYLIIDLPPGTGDIQLTLSQKVPVTGAVIVTTPQDIALLDARKAVKMFEKVSVPIFGVIENMSVHICSQCGHQEAIFGSHGAELMAEQYNLELLGEIPLEMSIREQSDSGKPIVEAFPESDAAAIFVQVALRIAGQLSMTKRDFASKFPNIVVEKA